MVEEKTWLTVFSCLGPLLGSYSLTQVFVTLAIINFVLIMAAAPMIYWGKALRSMTASSYLKFAARLES